ncbi:MAG: LmeA family phospholipid-binding protein [Acidimicrobiales bacterium]|nr:LmeA family phospholipid-binding protein [Acidimicrobiales bacterium]
MTADRREQVLSIGRSVLAKSQRVLSEAAGAAVAQPRRVLRVHRPAVDVRPIGGWHVPRRLPPLGLELRARGVVVSGLRLHRVTVRVADIASRPGMPLALRAGRITVGATLTEPDVNAWLADAHLPVRLRFSADGIQARTGMGGLALGTADVKVSLDAGVLHLSSRRVAVLGIGLSTAALPPTRLPLPPLPRSARLTGLRTEGGRVTARLSLPATTVPIGRATLREGIALARSGRLTVGAPPSRGGRPRAGRSPGHDPGGATTNSMRMVSPRVVEASLAPQEETP